MKGRTVKCADAGCLRTIKYVGFEEAELPARWTCGAAPLLAKERVGQQKQKGAK